MARRKNMARRRIILRNTFSLIRERGIDNVSFQLIAQESGISKSLLQSYYPHKIKLTSDIVNNLFNTIDQQVRLYDKFDYNSVYARANAFIYTIAEMGFYDESLDRLIIETFNSEETLTNWAIMLGDWIQDNHLLANIDKKINEIRAGLLFISSGISRLYRSRARYRLTAEELSDYVTRTFMYSFLRLPVVRINEAIRDGHEIAASSDIESVHNAIVTMFDDDKEIIS